MVRGHIIGKGTHFYRERGYGGRRMSPFDAKANGAWLRGTKNVPF